MTEPDLLREEITVQTDIAENPNVKTCSIDGCNRKNYGKSLCRKHYMRLYTHGDPRAGRTENGAPLRFIESEVLSFVGGECLDWPYAKTGGYGRLTVDGQDILATRYVCERTHGAPPSDAHQAAHLCGHCGCVNPSHLAWKTQKENDADKITHGTMPRGEKHVCSKLKETDVLDIRAAAGVVPQSELCRRYGIAQSSISLIQSGRNWGWLSDGASDA